MMNPPAWRRLITVQTAAQTQKGASLSWTGRSKRALSTRMREGKKKRGQAREEKPSPSPEVQSELRVSNHWTDGHVVSSPSDMYSVGAKSQPM